MFQRGLIFSLIILNALQYYFMIIRCPEGIFSISYVFFWKWTNSCRISIIIPIKFRYSFGTLSPWDTVLSILPNDVAVFLLHINLASLIKMENLRWINFGFINISILLCNSQTNIVSNVFRGMLEKSYCHRIHVHWSIHVTSKTSAVRSCAGLKLGPQLSTNRLSLKLPLSTDNL
jgi:hypothetical protein